MEAKPAWLKAKIPSGEGYSKLNRLVRQHKLHTVCQEARCPNQDDCWNRGTATMMLLGDTCTRACAFCNVKTGRPGHYDREEPMRVAESVSILNLRFVTLTSVDRDDLDDMGSEVWAETIRRVRQARPGIKIEALIPDFQGNTDIEDVVLDAGPDVLNHNMETVRRLQKPIRKFANWDDSRTMLIHARDRGFTTKTGLMVGLGETMDEIKEFIAEMAELKVDILTIGQYLQPSPKHHPVMKYYEPELFKELGEYAKSLGIPVVESGPLVRSSYHADESESLVPQKEKLKALDI